MKTTPYSQDTIAALATPPGEGGIAVLRISGPDAVAVASRIFQGQAPLSECASGRVRYGAVVRDGVAIDEVLATVFRAPRSYTGEDVVELSGHGGVYVSRRVVEAALWAGARLAHPGEFTQRAFFNGRLDLAQAQAVADLIHAQSESARRVAMAQLGGRLSAVIEGYRQRLIHACGLLEIELDFVEEDIEAIDKTALRDELQTLGSEIRALIATYQRGRICREGLRLVILGKPNVGKSSLLNALLARERAIVTDTPGTTRDTIEDQLDLDGLLVTVTDTAGIRASADAIEQEGVRRSEAAARQAGMVLVILDGSQPFTSEDGEVLTLARSLRIPVLVVSNKRDLPQATGAQREEGLSISAKTGEGVGEVVRAIRDHALGAGLPGVEDVVIAHARHVQALEKVGQALDQTLASLSKGLSQEFVAMDLRGALDALGEITGETSADEILNHVFASFCIGK